MKTWHLFGCSSFFAVGHLDSGSLLVDELTALAEFSDCFWLWSGIQFSPSFSAIVINAQRSHSLIAHMIGKNERHSPINIEEYIFSYWFRMTLHVTYVKHMDPISINSRKTHGPYQHQQHKNTWTTVSINSTKTHGPLSAPTAEKHMDPISTNSRKTHGPLSTSTAEKHMDHCQHQQHKNTWMLSAPTAQKHVDAIRIKASSRMSRQQTNLGPPIWEEEKRRRKKAGH